MAATTQPTRRPSRASQAGAAAKPPTKPKGSPRYGAADYARVKASRVGALMQIGGDGQPVWTRRRFDAFALEAYILNVVASRCISLVAGCKAALPLMVEQGSTRLRDHPALALLAQPNPMQGQQRFLRAVETFYKIAGNAYVEAVTVSRKPRELWTLRPDRVTILESATGIPAGFRYETGRGKFDFPMDPITGQSDLLHLKSFHPLDDWYGLADTEPAARSIDQFNAAAAHNASLLQKGVRPSGFLALKTAATREQIEMAEAILAEKWEGTDNAGKVQVLGGDWQWIPAGQTIKDMDFWEGTQQQARQICAAYGVPHVLIVPGEATYRNRDSAYLEFYEATVLPEADITLGDLERWLKQWFPGRWKLTYDKDLIWALTPRRVAHRQQVVTEWKEGLITRDEAREALQYPPAPNAGEEYSKPTVSDTMDMQEHQAEVAAANPKPAPAKPPKPSKATQAGETKATPEPGDVASDIPDELLLAEVLPAIRTVIEEYGQQVFEELAVVGDFDLLDPKVVKFLEEYGATRIKQLVGSTTRNELAASLASGVRLGESTTALMKRIQTVFDAASKDRARMIAETEVTIASGVGTQAAMEESGTQFKVWLATGDGHTRDTHVKLDGQIQPVAEPFLSTSGARGQHPGGFGVASEDIYCFPGETRVRSLGAIRRVYRRRYEGTLIRIETADGQQLALTPNHPVMTEGGHLISAGLLEVGDKVIRDSFAVEATAGRSVNPDDAPARLDEVYRLALMTGATERARGLAPQFHGDGGEGEVEIVTLNRELLIDHEAALADEPGKGSLATADVGAATGLCDRPALKGRGSVPLASPGGVSGLREGPALVGAGASHPDGHSGASASRLDPAGREDAADDAAVDPGFARKRLLALAGPVAGGQRAASIIVKVEATAWSGHVFTLETEGGLFVAENIVVSNCRCASGPFVPGVDGPLPEPLRERFNLTEEGAPKASPGRRNTKSLKLRKAAREKLRGPLVDAVEAAFKAGFEKQRAYVARRFRRLALIAGTPVEEVNPGEAEMVG